MIVANRDNVNDALYRYHYVIKSALILIRLNINGFRPRKQDMSYVLTISLPKTFEA